MALFEGYERRIDKVNNTLKEYGIKDLAEAQQICTDVGVDVIAIVKEVQPICFDNACWAYIAGAAIALKKGQTRAAEIASILGIGLQSFCIPGSVAEWPAS